MDTVHELAPSTNWLHVMENLDHEDLNIPDESGFNLLMAVYARASKEPFPLHAVCGSLWKNTDAQISFLKHAVMAPPDKFSFSHCSRQLEYLDLGSLSRGNQAWYCLDLLEVLCRLADAGHIVSVRLMIEDPLGHCPELLLLGLGHVKTEHNLLQKEVLSSVFSTVLKDTAKSNVVKYLWRVNPCLTLGGFVEAHSDRKCLLRIADLCQQLQILSAVLDSAPFPFNIKLAAAASRKDQDLVGKWLSEKSEVYKSLFLEECVNILEEILSSSPMKEPQVEVMNMYWRSSPLFLEVCRSHSGKQVSTQLLDKHSKVNEEQIRDMTLKYLLGIIEYHIGRLVRDQRFCKGFIFKEERKLFELKGQRYEYPHGKPDLSEEKFGPIVRKLKTLSKSNHESLKCMKEGLLACFNSDPLLSEVKAIIMENTAIFKKAAPVISQYHDFIDRVNTEISWLNRAAKKAEHVYGLLSGRQPVLAELESRIYELKRRVTVLSKECPESLYSRCQALDTVAKLWEDVDLLMKELVMFRQAAEDLCLISKNLRSLLSEKNMYAHRFHITEQHIKRESHQLHGALLDLQLKVEQAEESYVEKMAGLSERETRPMKYEKLIIDNAISWRTRLFRGKNILGTMREQGLDMCGYVSTVVMTESLFKRAWPWPSEFVIKLSEYHLQDIVRAFCAKNKMKGKDTLDVCLGKMVETGVVSESTYNGADFDTMGFDRYRISEFEKLEPPYINESIDKLEDGTVLIGTFGITKGYFSLGPDDVYDAPEDSEFEIGPSGKIPTHAVVIVGYGVTLAGFPYYVFQNWYGPAWGRDGFGMVTARSIRLMYAAEL